MKIEIPDWAQDGHLRVILNGVETVAYKDNGKDSPIMIKVIRCNQCGECCLDIIGHQYADEEGKCKFLVNEDGKLICNAGGLALKSCLPDPIGEYDCPIRYEEQK